jgi:hypothetical protein
MQIERRQIQRRLSGRHISCALVGRWLTGSGWLVAADCDPGEMCVCNVIGAYIDPFQARPTRTLGPGETDDVTFAVRASVR